jgi:hypothetical protein
VPHYCSCDVLRHIDAFVCLPHGDRLPRRVPPTLLPARATLSPTATRPFPFAGACPTLDLAANGHSNPIAHRVRRKRQRLPPSLLIENASDRVSVPLRTVLPEAFPIKASGKPEVEQRFKSPRSPRPYSLNWICRKLVRSLDFSISHFRRGSKTEANMSGQLGRPQEALLVPTARIHFAEPSALTRPNAGA